MQEATRQSKRFLYKQGERTRSDAYSKLRRKEFDESLKLYFKATELSDLSLKQEEEIQKIIERTKENSTLIKQKR